MRSLKPLAGGAAGVAVAALTALSVLAAPVPAFAANGEFTYDSVDGDQLTLTDPVDGECYLLVSGALTAFNGTDRVAVVFEDHGCEDAAAAIPPGLSVVFGEPVPHSVRFG